MDNSKRQESSSAEHGDSPSQQELPAQAQALKGHLIRVFAALCALVFVAYEFLAETNRLDRDPGMWSVASMVRPIASESWPGWLSFNTVLSLTRGTSQRLDNDGTIISDLAISDDGRYVASLGAGGSIIFANTDDPAANRAFAPEIRPTKIALSSEARLLVTADENGRVQTWSFDDGFPRRQGMDLGGTITELVVSANGHLAVLEDIGNRSRVTLFELLDPAQDMVWQQTFDERLLSLTFYQQGSLLAAGDADGQIHRINTATGDLTEAAMPQTGAPDGAAPARAAISAIAGMAKEDGLLIGRIDGSVEAHVAGYAVPLTRLAGEIEDIGFVFDGDTLEPNVIALSSSGALFRQTYRLPASLRPYAQQSPSKQGPADAQQNAPAQQPAASDYRRLAISENGIMAASTLFGRVLRLEDAPTGNQVAATDLYTHAGMIADLALSKDGRFLLSSGWSGTFSLFATGDLTNSSFTNVGLGQDTSLTTVQTSSTATFLSGSGYQFVMLDRFGRLMKGQLTPAGQPSTNVDELATFTSFYSPSYAHSVPMMALGSGKTLILGDLSEGYIGVPVMTLPEDQTLVAVWLSDNARYLAYRTPTSQYILDLDGENLRTTGNPRTFEALLEARVITELPFEAFGRIQGFVPGGDTRLLTSSSSGVSIRETGSGAVIATVSDTVIRDHAWSPDGSMMVYVDGDGFLNSFEVASGRRLGEAIAVRDNVRVSAVTIADDGTLYAGDFGGFVHTVQPSLVPVRPPLWTLPALPLALLFFALSVWVYLRARDIWNEEKERLGKPSPVRLFLEADVPLSDKSSAGEAMTGLVNRLFRFVTNKDVAAPLTFALLGKWGSGKSSVMALLTKDLKKHKHPVVWFNAWHHQNEERLFAALMDTIKNGRPLPVFSLANLMFRLRLFHLRFSRTPLRSTVAVTLALLGSIALLVALIDTEEGPIVQGLLGIGSLVAAGGSLWLLAGNLIKPFNLNPARLLKDTSGLFQVSSFKSEIGFRHQFGEAFNDVCEAFGNKRLVLIIDDLDRCRPELVVETLEAVNFLVTKGNCFIFLGISEEPVLHAVGLSFRQMAEESALAKDAQSVAAAPATTTPAPTHPTGGGEGKVQPLRADGGAAHQAAQQDAEHQPGDDKGANTRIDEFEARKQFAQQYLEKLINLRINVPEISISDLRNWMRNAERTMGQSTSINWVKGVATLAMISLSAVAVTFAAPTLSDNISSFIAATQSAAGPRDNEDGGNRSDGQVGSQANTGGTGKAEEGTDGDTTKEPSQPSGGSSDQQASGKQGGSAGKAPNQLASDNSQTTGNQAAGGDAGRDRRDQQQALSPFRDLQVTETAETSENTLDYGDILIELLVLGLLITVGLLYWWQIRRSTRNPAEAPESDSSHFQTAFTRWVLLVLAFNKSPRAIKRFANRMRYLVADEIQTSASRIERLVALGALDECGLITAQSDLIQLRSTKTFQQTLAESIDSVEQEIGVFEGFRPQKVIDDLTEGDIEHYWQLAGSVRFSAPENSEDTNEKKAAE